MRCWVVAMLFAVMQTPSPVPRKAANHRARASSNAQSQATTNKAPATPAQPPINVSAAPSKEAPSNNVRAEDTQKAIRIRELPPVSISKDWTDRTYWLFSGFLAFVGGLQVLLLWRTLGAITRQTRATEIAANAAIANAEAAKANAEASRENIEVFKDKDRARLRVEVSGLNLPPPANVLSHYVSYFVRIYGPTNAFVVDCGATAMVSDSSDPPSDISTWPMMLPEVITPEMDAINKHAFLRPNINLSQAEIDDINEGKSFVHFGGFIKYTDIFKDGHEIRFRYVWKLSMSIVPPLPGQPRIGDWLKCGTEDDNKET